MSSSYARIDEIDHETTSDRGSDGSDSEELEELPLPFRNQRWTIQTHRPTALKLREQFPDIFIRFSKDVLAKWHYAKYQDELHFGVQKYAYETDSDIVIVFRATVYFDFETDLYGQGDADDPEQAQKVAALQALFQLVENDAIDKDGLPTKHTPAGEHDLPHEVFQDHEEASSERYNSPPTSVDSPPPTTKESAGDELKLAGGADLAASDRLSLAFPKPVSAILQDKALESLEIEAAARALHAQPLTATAYAQQTQTTAPSISVSSLVANIHALTASTGTSFSSPQISTLAPPEIDYETASAYIDYYCKRFGYSYPMVHCTPTPNGSTTIWTATMWFNGQDAGSATALTKAAATRKTYCVAVAWSAMSEPAIWNSFVQSIAHNNHSKRVAEVVAAAKSKTAKVPSLALPMTPELVEEIQTLAQTIKNSTLYKRGAALASRLPEHAFPDETAVDLPPTSYYPGIADSDDMSRRSYDLTEWRRGYLSDRAMDRIRQQRDDLPITQHADSLIKQLQTSQVAVVLASTGSGKTTQVPQLILDDFIKQGKGGECRIVCTQPRRLAAITVARRMASERGEPIGKSVGYQVRFDVAFPEKHGSILLCTTGICLKRLQTGHDGKQQSFLDGVTHVCVDEVHERDVDIDLLLYVLRRELHDRIRQKRPLFKIVLMSATIDPTLLCKYFADPVSGEAALTIEVPGRSHRVERYDLDKVYERLYNASRHIAGSDRALADRDTSVYLDSELRKKMKIDADGSVAEPARQPSSLVALTIAYICLQSRHQRDGHILVFLPGLEQIESVRKILLNHRLSLLDIDFSRYDIHVLHSSTPINDQQAVFAPAAQGQQRIILATNIAETSLTIPDVVYVVDTGTCKQKRFDPERRLSSLVATFTGTSNMEQRAGRAGRHRPGQYYSLVSARRRAILPEFHLVEMKRLDLSNIVMHIKGMGPNLQPADVLQECIEPPAPSRVSAAINSLTMLGALDARVQLTPLGRVLLSLPVEAAIGRLCILGCLFKCLDQATTIAAVLNDRDPFLNPIDKKEQADAAKRSFSPPGYTSDVLAAVNAFNQWDNLRPGFERDRFCDEYFLSRSTLRMMEQVKDQILQTMHRSGILSVLSDGRGAVLVQGYDGQTLVPTEFNSNGESLPVLSAMIAIAVSPHFGLSTIGVGVHTGLKSSGMVHPGSMHHPSKRSTKADKLARHLYAYVEATSAKEVKEDSSKPQFMLRGITKVDPLGLMLLGAHGLARDNNKLLCNGWLPVETDGQACGAIKELRDVCQKSLLRFYEGLSAVMTTQRAPSESMSRGEYEDSWEPQPELPSFSSATLSEQEIAELANLSSEVVNVLHLHSQNASLPIFANIARTSTARQEPVLHASRKDAMSIKGSAQARTMSRPPSASTTHVVSDWGAWQSTSAENDAWTHPATMRDGDSRLPVNGGPSVRTPIPTATDGPVASTSTDPWDSYKPASTANDAYERRIALSMGQSAAPSVPASQHAPVAHAASESTPTDVAVSTAVEQGIAHEAPAASQQSASETAVSAASSQQPGGWGDEYLESIKPEADWDMSYTPTRFLVHPSVPDLQISKPAEGSMSTGWQPYKRYSSKEEREINLRMREPSSNSSSEFNDSGPSTRPYESARNLGHDDDRSARENQPAQSASMSWDTWSANNGERAGEDAYQRRMRMSNGAPHSLLAQSPPTASQQPLPQHSHATSLHSNDSNDHSSDGHTHMHSASGAQQAAASSESRAVDDDGWSNYKPADDSERQGAVAYARRVGMPPPTAASTSTPVSTPTTSQATPSIPHNNGPSTSSSQQNRLLQTLLNASPSTSASSSSAAAPAPRQISIRGLAKRTALDPTAGSGLLPKSILKTSTSRSVLHSPVPSVPKASNILDSHSWDSPISLGTHQGSHSQSQSQSQSLDTSGWASLLDSQ